MLHVALVTIVLVSTARLFVVVASGELAPFDLAPPGLAAALLAALHLGRVHFAGYALVLASWSLMVYRAVHTGGVRSVSLGGLILIVILATLLFGRRALLAALHKLGVHADSLVDGSLVVTIPPAGSAVLWARRVGWDRRSSR